MPYVFFMLICAIWGGSFLLMKKAHLCFGPLSIGGWRVMSGALVLMVAWRFAGGGWPFKRAHLLPLLGTVLLGYVWPYCLQPYLVGRLGSGFVGMSVSFTPLMTVLASIPMLHIYPSPRQLAGVLGGLACIGVVLSGGLAFDATPLDLALAVSVPAAYAVANTYVKRRFTDLPALALTCAALGLAGALILPVTAFLPSESVRSTEHLGLALLSLGVLGVFGTGLAMFMFYKLVQDQGPLFAGMVTYLVPIGALALGWLDGETVSARQLAGLAGIFLMVALAQSGRKPAAKPAAPPR
ncbi:MAG: DMT family transporter [Planctomycetota bacterium]|nr:DMT family transporter [Planctomycetota bacterium]